MREREQFAALPRRRIQRHPGAGSDPASSRRVSHSVRKFSLSTKVSVTLAGTLFFAVLGSVVALVSAVNTRDALETVASENMSDAIGVGELEVSLLQQGGFVAAYLLNGDRTWLDELTRRKPDFESWLGRVRRQAYSAEEQRILAELGEVFRKYDAKRQDAVELYDQGESEEAERVFIDEVMPLFDRAFHLCEDLVEENNGYIENVVGEQQLAVRRTTVLVGGFSLLTTVLVVGFLVFFFRSILFPLRRIAREARRFSVGGKGPGLGLYPDDELRAVRFYLETLKSDVAAAHSDLADSHERLAIAERLASVGQLAATVAHEIRNPLTSLKMRLYKLQRGMGERKEYERDFSIMAGELNRLDVIVREFLEFARPRGPNLQACRAEDVIERTVEVLRHQFEESGVKVIREAAPGIPDMKADPEQISQVLINLLKNALEAMGRGGEVRIRAGVEKPDGGPRMLVIRVEDTGPGIAEHDRDRVFEPFFTTKEEGAGLGLCVAGRIMARHGGKLELESSTRNGACFALWIPLEGDEDEPHSHRR